MNEEGAIEIEQTAVLIVANSVYELEKTLIRTRSAVIDDDVATRLLWRIRIFLSDVVAELLVQSRHEHLVELHLRSCRKTLQLVHVFGEAIVLFVMSTERLHIHPVQMIEHLLSHLRVVERNQLLVQNGVLGKERLHLILCLFTKLEITHEKHLRTLFPTS